MTAQHFDPETVHSCSYHCQRPACIVRRESREILALSLGEFGHYQEAENVLKGIDLDEYRFELYAIQSALSKRGAAVPKPEKTTQEPVEMSPEFTDTARAAITWVLYHHQGGGSPIGQPLRFALGMGAHDPLPEWRIAEAKRYAEFAGATTAKFHEARASAPAAPARLVEAARDVIEAIRAIPESSLLTLDFDPHPPSSLSVHADDLEAALASAKADHLPDTTKMVGSGLHAGDASIVERVASSIEEGRLAHPGFLRNAEIAAAVRRVLRAAANSSNEARDAARYRFLCAISEEKLRRIPAEDNFCIYIPTWQGRWKNVHAAVDAAMAGEVQP